MSNLSDGGSCSRIRSSRYPYASADLMTRSQFDVPPQNGDVELLVMIEVAHVPSASPGRRRHQQCAHHLVHGCGWRLVARNAHPVGDGGLVLLEDAWTQPPVVRTGATDGIQMPDWPSPSWLGRFHRESD
jgi:hypothetical protein